MKLNWKWLTRRKLRVDILTIFAVLMTAIFFSIIAFSYVKTSELILNLGRELIDKSISSLVKKFDDYVSPAAFFDISSALLDDGWLDNKDKDNLTEFMKILLKTHPQLTSAYIADEHNNMFIQSRLYPEQNTEMATLFLKFSDIPKDTKAVTEIMSRVNDRTLLNAIFTNEQGKVIGEKKELEINYIPRNQKWYKGALNSSSRNWVVVDNYNDASGIQMTVSQSVAFHDKDVGVIAVDINIDMITHYLQDYRVSKNSETFVVDHADNVIATIANSARGNNLLPHIEDLNNKKLITVYHIFKTTGKRNFTFVSDDIEYLAKIVSYALIKDVGWEIVTIVPINDFIGQTKNEYREIMAFSFLMLIIGLFFVLIFSYKISRPIMKLAKDTLRQIDHLDFEKHTIIKTHIYEIQVLIDAFNAMKKAMSSFSKYIPKALTTQMLHAGSIATVGGERKEISLLFSDIRNFASIAEKISPEVLMAHVSEYLNVMTQIIHQHSGNVDKYIGDSVMAFWGAPLDDPNHAINACQAALSCCYQINELNDKWKKEEKPLFYTRFGINTGTTVVGNMGSFDRLNYTAIGDEVNVAARLEQINKIYGTQIIVSDAVYQKCKRKFLFRPIDIVRVKGKANYTVIYQLVASNEGAKETLATAEQKELCQLTFAAYEAFHAGQTALSRSFYAAILDKFPDDPVAIFYLNRLNQI